MSDSQRNFLILIAVAIGGYFAFTGFAITSATINHFIQIAFAVMIGIYAILWTQRNMGSIKRIDKQSQTIVFGMIAFIEIVNFSGSFGWWDLKGTFHGAWALAAQGRSIIQMLMMGGAALVIHNVMKSKSGYW